MRPACADRGCQPEEKWYALTGRVVDAKVEADGDIHLALQDADGKNAGTVSAEIPVGPKWCEIRQMVFGWTKQKFPFTVKSVHDFTIAEHVQDAFAVDLLAIAVHADVTTKRSISKSPRPLLNSNVRTNLASDQISCRFLTVISFSSFSTLLL